METWFTIIISLCLIFLFRALLSLLQKSSTIKINNPFPPGPTHIPIITPIIWLTKSVSQLEPIIKQLHVKYGPIVTLQIGSSPTIFINDRSIAHQALIQNGSIFSDRPVNLPMENFISKNQHNITSASYDTTWRILRRNLTAEMLHPSRVKSFAQTRKWVLDVLLKRIKTNIKSSDSIKAKDHIQHAMFSLLVFMCFGQRVDDEKLHDIEQGERNLLVSLKKFNVLNFWPKITKILFRKRWEELLKLRSNQEMVLVPLIRVRKEAKKNGLCNDNNNPRAYVDTLLDLKLSNEGQRNLDEGEVVALCSEFLSAGTDTTSTALQWIMANLVKHPHMQQRIVDEIRKVMAVSDKEEKEEVHEEDLEKLPYLKAVVLESLRRHPPTHFLLPHAVSEDVAFNGYLVPKKGSVNFMVAEIGRDPKVWEDPMAFKPERFLNEDGSQIEGFDITGSKEIKMMPFGAGRRICPAYNLGMLHLEYFVANLVWNFDWKD
ncbi:hypothetical protein TanjilG_11861 [Lupinus angustifolius]|uniref:Cytochrome P450 n=1 Tax=Lupinus angustifolius TaxID=3871 RepID=A0A1J7FPP7_LUPAN|nr:hypothetical protein TanjilG_11861 [Lupinus angustifolius]